MLISKFDLYRHEWLELVFDSRNKEYGAYELRQHYAGNMVRAMSITFLGVGLLFGAGMFFRTNHVQIAAPPHDPVITVTLHPPVNPPVTPPKKAADLPKPAEPIKTTQFLVPVVTADKQVTTPPPLNAKIEGAVGLVTTNSKDGGDSVIPDIDANNGPATAPGPDMSIHTVIGLEALPEPIGGEKAWAKFLNKNLRYPAEAQDENVSGRVILSFVVEKDGSISNVVVDRQAGHGFDEEAVRVLKLAKPWKPGIQNGQPVRVRFEIPINFQIGSSD